MNGEGKKPTDFPSNTLEDKSAGKKFSDLHPTAGKKGAASPPALLSAGVEKTQGPILSCQGPSPLE